MRSVWADMLADLMREHRVSERKLSDVAGLNRATLRRFLAGGSGFSTRHIEKAFAAFGYECDVLKVGQIDPRLLPAVLEKPVSTSKPLKAALKSKLPSNIQIVRRKTALVPFAGQSAGW